MDPVTMAALGMAAYGIGKGMFGGKKKGGGYQFQPYGGLEPPRIDYVPPAGVNYGSAVDALAAINQGNQLRPVQSLMGATIARRSQGEDVGYDPQRRASQEALLKSQLDRREEDETRSARGMAARSGLSGNLAAQNALEGKVHRDIGRTYGEGLAQISIEDLARANQERDTNTARLQDLNTFNFGQENNVADFQLRKYMAEQGLQVQGGAQNLGYENLASEENAGYGALGAYSLNSLMNRSPVMAPPETQTQTGQGIVNPTSTGGITGNTYQPNDALSALYRSRRKRIGTSYGGMY